MPRWPLRKEYAAVCSAMGAAALLTFCASARAIETNGFELEVSKTAVTSFTRTYLWEITKTVDAEALALDVGVPGDVAYTIALLRSYVDSERLVTGTITISNPNYFPVDVYRVEDYVGGLGGTQANLDCSGNIAAQSSMTCEYSVALEEGGSGTNFVYVYDVSGNGTFIDGPFIGEADFDFANPTTTVNECVTVVDAALGLNELVCVDDTSFTRYRTFKYDQPGVYQVVNTATIVETGQSDDATVRITVGQVPEPGTLALLGLGLAGLAATRRRRK